MSKENIHQPDIAGGEPFAFTLSREAYKNTRYVCVPDSVCDNPSCECMDLGMAIYAYPEEGKELSTPPLYAFVLDLKNQSLQSGFNTSRESQDFAAAFFDHTTREHWALYKKAFTTLKAQAIAQKKLLKGTSETVAGQMVSLGPDKMGRNDPCSCGSGKKYKNCCGS